MARPGRLLAALALASLALAPLAHALPGKIVIKNLDAAGEGFNVSTPAAPVGGNAGTTVGQQRLNVFQHAANIWGAILNNPDTIYVDANFDSLTCTPTSAVLGSAGPTFLDRDDPAYPFPGTWYHIALAEKLAGARLLPNGTSEIQAHFNSELDGAPTCLGGTTWYYGFDGNEGAQIELLPVVLHELGHGLGFSSTTNGQTGVFNTGFPGVFDRFLYDSLTGRTWANASETAAQRIASAISIDKLSWSGAAGKYGVTHQPLMRRPKLTVNSAPVAGVDSLGQAEFGGTLTVGGVTGNVVLVTDGSVPTNDGCTALTNAGAVSGNIAIVDRGACNFNIKAQTAQAAGAIGLIIVNNAAGSFTASGVDPSITIPIVTVTLGDGKALKNAIAGGLNVTLSGDAVLYAGADGSQRPLMYAPNPFQGGSSVSHFDVTTLPNALMEPAINASLSSAVDLTTHVFVDIGWLPMTTPTALATFTADDREEGVLLAWRFADDSDISTLTLQRATSEAGPWTAVETELYSRDGMTVAMDTAVERGVAYYWRLNVVDRDGHESNWGMVTAFHSGTAAGPAALFAPSPNPTPTGTTMSFRLPRPEFVRLDIVDASGRRVRSLQDGMLAAGEYQRWWDGTAGGRRVPPGLYFGTLRTSAGLLTQRIAVIR
jgi:hypothetical protein